MSKRTNANASMRGAAKKAAGAHLTVQGRQQTMSHLTDFLYALGYQVTGVDGLREQHIALYVRSRIENGIDKRTLQNDMSEIRGALRAAGRSQAANSHGISNVALGISGASRSGTNTAATDEQFAAAVALASKADPGVAIALELERAIGLRGKEAVQAGQSLALWQGQLIRGDRVIVVHGTKGGRAREARVPDPPRALEVIGRAMKLAGEQNGRLINKPSLKQAMTRYRNIAHRYVSLKIGVTPHALRYAYAGEQVAAYERSGFSKGLALAMTSMDLGHGDGRGRYVEAVYTKQGRPTSSAPSSTSTPSPGGQPQQPTSAASSNTTCCQR